MFSLKNEKSWIKIVLTLIIIINLSVNLYCVFKYGNYFILGNFEKMDNDDVRYIRTAQILLEKHILIDNEIDTPAVNMMPGHPVILAGFIKLFGDSDGLVAFRVFQAFLQALSLILIFLIARDVFNSKTAILTCLLDAIYIPEIASVGLILMEVTFKFLLLLLLYISIHAVRTKNTRLYIAGGFTWGIACLFRPTIALFPVLILIMWIVRKYSFKEMLKYGAAVVLVFSLVMSPWWIRNYMTFNKFIPLMLASGNPFLQGTYINYDQSRDVTHYTPSKNAVKNNEIEMETGKLRLKTYFKQNPLQYLQWYTIGKTWYMWRHPYYWKKVLGVSPVMAKNIHHLILITFLVGIAACFRRKSSDAALLIMLVLYFDVVHLPFYTFSRYAYPVMPVVITLSSFGVYSAATSKIWSKLLSINTLLNKYMNPTSLK